jgi:anti-sigma factor RsiW
VLICYRTRRRLGAYLDAMLPEGDLASAGAHVAGCRRCQSEVAALRRMRERLQESLSVAPPTDWAGFWPGIVRGIEERRRRPAPAPARTWPVWRPSLAFGGAVAALLVASLTAWQLWAPGASSPTVVVSSAQTEDPAAGLMVYAPPEKDLAVIWIFSEE